MRVEIEKAQVEVCIVSNEDRRAEKSMQLGKDDIDTRLIAQQVIRDTCQSSDECRHPPSWVHQGMKLLAQAAIFDPYRRDFGDRRRAGLEAGGFEVNNDKLGVTYRLVQGSVGGEVPTIGRWIVGEVRVRSQSDL